MKAQNAKNQKKYVLNGKKMSFNRIITELNKFKEKIVSITTKGQKQVKGIIQTVQKNRKKITIIPINEQYGNCFKWDEEENISVEITDIRTICLDS